MAKARKKHKPAKRPRKATTGSKVPLSTPESVMELAERAAERIRKLAPAPPSQAELTERAKARAEARKTIQRYIAIRDNQIPPPWAEKNRSEELHKTTTKHIRKGGQTTRLLPLLRELYPPDGLPPADIKTVAIMKRVLDAYDARGLGTVSRDTVEQAIGRGRRRKR